MSLPQFTAEAALGPAAGRYAGAAVFSEAGIGEVSPMQFFGSAGIFGRFGFRMRCCGFSSLLHRLVCTERIVSPLEHCECDQDTFGEPLISCTPPVLSQG